MTLHKGEPRCNDCANRWSASLETDGPKYEPCPKHRSEQPAQINNYNYFQDGTPVEIYENPEGTYVNYGELS